MTGEEHSKRVGLLHLVYGGFFSLVSVIVLLFSGLFTGFLSVLERGGDAPNISLFWTLAGIMLTFQVVQAVPALASGYGLLKKKPWARTAALVTSALAALVFPFGTALSAYTFWFLFGEKGQEYERSLAATDWRGYLREGDALSVEEQMEAQLKERDLGYQPPQQPPDWRGETETGERREI